MKTRAYYNTRKPFRPTPWTIYTNEGGGEYLCVPSWGDCCDLDPVMMNVASGWRFTARGCGIYEDGCIDWDYSTSGDFAPDHVRADLVDRAIEMAYNGR